MTKKKKEKKTHSLDPDLNTFLTVSEETGVEMMLLIFFFFFKIKCLYTAVVQNTCNGRSSLQ